MYMVNYVYAYYIQLLRTACNIIHHTEKIDFLMNTNLIQPTPLCLNKYIILRHSWLISFPVYSCFQ